MAEKILMPKLSPTMEEGQISSWLKEEGDKIEANETIAEVDTDKATMEMTSLTAGTLLKIIVPAGENARLGQIIGVLGEPGEDFSDILKEAESSPNGAAKEPSKEETEKKPEAKPVEEPEKAAAAASNGDTGGRLLVSPIAARMASENGIDLKTISGSGPNGRIIKRDIEQALEAPSQAKPAAERSFVFGQAAEVEGASAFREENTSPMRRTIAKRLAESIGPVPTFYLTVEIEMDRALETRKQINEAIAPDKISVNDIIVKAAAMALTRHPFVNASYQDDKIRFYEDADIGVAVAIDEGLITPIVRGANKKGFVQISSEISELAERARDKKLQPEEYTGATFSISNLGMFGIKEFTAIINPPEAAILAVGRAEPVPVVRDGEIVVKSIMHVTMSCDHRVVDGATGAKFLQTFRKMLENPALMLA
ncbi:MAG: pyruvate dehydrogenase complex dihydrolipoamide acetyltransferase [Acidobacteriota bacterium]|nr:MAG: pyruvate dehydrogenase complex dihydrolipoamide acetyltransferase [Acidobacteriota bacterium]